MGCNRGISHALAQELKTQRVKVITLCRSSSFVLEKFEPNEIVLGLDILSDKESKGVASKIKGVPIDIVCIFEEDTFFCCLNRRLNLCISYIYFKAN